MRALEELEVMRREGGLAERCRASAERRFDIEHVGGVKYRRLYERLLQTRGGVEVAERAFRVADLKR